MSAGGQAGRGLDRGQPSASIRDEVSISDVVAAVGRLTPESSLEAVESSLRNLSEQTAGVNQARRALVREAAIELVKNVKAVSAPARLVDAFFERSLSRDDSLQGQALDLPDPERWPEPVDVAELLDELAGTFRRFLALPPGADVILALWVVFAHAHDAFSISPVLAITSPVMRCGKSTLLDLLTLLVPRPLGASNLTAATLFRSIEKFRPTFLVDEGDTFL